MSKKKISILLVLVVMLIAGVLGFKSLNPSTPNHTDDSKFNVSRQMEHIKNIAKEPHSIFNVEAKEKVRDYLLEELSKLGVKTKTYKYDDVYVERTDSKADLENIYGEIKGESDSYIMLVTHYDTSQAKKERYAEKDGSLGAADAGYGLSTILETLRVIKESDVKLKNGIKILITDGEEYGLLGAKEAVKESEIFENVNYLVNIEARGTEGPAIMFETSPNNSGVLDLYESSYKPFSYSITPEIYRLLPNSTDFTVFLEKGLTGVNISVLDGLENYHTPGDNPHNLSEKSMQHYGDQVLPIVKEFITNEKYSSPNAFESKDDSIFFILGNIFVRYSKAINMAFLAVVLLAMVFIVKRLQVKNVKNVAKCLGQNVVFTVGAVAFGYVVSRIVAVLNGREFKLTYLPLMKFEGIIFIVVIALVFVVYFKSVRDMIAKTSKEDVTVAILILMFVLGVALSFALPGASYLVVFPLLLTVIALSVKLLLNGKKYSSLVLLIPVFIIVLLYVPTIYLFNCALTFGALCANILFAMFAYMMLNANFVNFDNNLE